MHQSNEVAPANFVLLHGMSQGAVASAVAVGWHGAKADALILESPFASPSALLEHLSSSSGGLNLLPIPSTLKQLIVAGKQPLQMAATLAQIPTAVGSIQQVTIPTLVVASAGDPLVPLEQTLEVAKAYVHAEFGRSDSSGDGVLDAQEFGHLSATMPITQVDSNQDGIVDAQEFEAISNVQVQVCDTCNHHAATANTDIRRWKRILTNFLARVNQLQS